MLPGGRELSVVAGRDRREIWTLEGFGSTSTPPDPMERPGGGGDVQ
jgi:hypothetical protein